MFAVVAVVATAAAAVVGGKAAMSSGPQDGAAAAAPEPQLPTGDGSAAGRPDATTTSASASASAQPTVTPAPIPQTTGPTRLPGGSTSTVPVQRSAGAPTAAGSSPAAVTPPARTASPTTASRTGADLDSAANQVLALINQARAEQGVAPLQMSAGLRSSANAHDQVMAAGCGLQHQCPGEADFGARERAAGVQWGTAGENIGTGGPVANTTAGAADMALGLTRSMLAERPPNDGHRRNILNPAFHHVGIELLRDSSGTLWMTQDFSD
ncbi:CAP domain-containing protein [Streptomyces sp. TLI_171]|uniref:CAP domain-containing protein n=1 Tax=Streptomyces sp. TLI_171 TaxID=1938859 RepID=UPI00117C15AD|nr:CAP domain-containing protein [Streptomyces sp. TLI_171]